MATPAPLTRVDKDVFRRLRTNVIPILATPPSRAAQTNPVARLQAHASMGECIEAIIGHLKSDGLMYRNFLRGFTGDKIHAVLCGVGLNLRRF